VRQELLEYLVKQQYSGFLDLAEALTAIRSKGVNFTFQRENAIALLDSWRRRDEIREQKNQTSSNRLHEPSSLEELIKLFRLHKMLRFFLEDYSINAPRPPWIQPVQWENNILPLHLSLSEKRRFSRAMCRLQTLKNIFGDPVQCSMYESCDSCGHNRVWQMGDTNEPRDISKDCETWLIREQAYKLFYGTMPLWEHEEMGSVLGYLLAKIESISNEVSDDLRQLSKNTPCEFFWDILPVEQRPPSGCDVETERDLVHFDRHFKGLAGLGPEFLYHNLHVDRLSRRNIVCVNTRDFWPGPFIGLRIGISRTDWFPFIDPADRYESQNFEELWSTLPPLEQPTVGWRKAWILPHNKEDYLEDSMDYDRKLEKDWEWAYALWDEGRLNEWSILSRR